jgi:orotate phosphoribosyltransferase-like protein
VPLPINKQRRSNIEWAGLVPDNIASEQEAFERGSTAIAMQRAGFTFQEIADAFGVSNSRAQQLAAKASSKIEMSPVERYFAEVEKPGLARKPMLRLAKEDLDIFIRHRA